MSAVGLVPSEQHAVHMFFVVSVKLYSALAWTQCNLKYVVDVWNKRRAVEFIPSITYLC
jgi:hypothetical protein